MEKLQKYHRDGPMEDPIVRCTECQAIVHRDTIKKIGMCHNCGNRRVRNISIISENEMRELKEKNIDSEFLALFEGVQ